ncbi:MAG: hypothetical protein Kow00109_09620 [Acidobacteriota bacterium]
MNKAVAFVGPSGSGKTTLICRLVSELQRRGLRCAVIKHAHHGFEMDHPGKDTFRMREAGAAAVVIASGTATAFWRREVEQRRAEELIEEFVADYDLVLVEGYHRSSLPKVLLPGAEEAGYEVVGPVWARVSATEPSSAAAPIPRFHRDEVAALADFLTGEGEGRDQGAATPPR